MVIALSLRLRAAVILALTGAGALAAVVLSGCGIVSGVRTAPTVHLRVSEDFGAHILETGSVPRLPGTVGALAFTRRFGSLSTSGARVTSIAGHRAEGAERWTLYVNGIDTGGIDPVLHDGDHVWWDLHDESAAREVPAVVGAYPEPFTNGTGGRSFPTVLTCASGLGDACDAVTRDLDRVGLKVSFQSLGTGSGSDSLAILLGTARQLSGVIASELLQAGPAQSGVYARFAGSRDTVLELENAAGSVSQTLSGSYGLIAATEEVGFSEPVWLITGTDRAGVSAAARAFSARGLADRFAVAVTPAGQLLSLPTS